MNRDGSYTYGSLAGEPGAESMNTRIERERYWRSLGKRVRKGAR